MRKSIVTLVIAATTAMGLVALAPAASAAKKPDPCKVLTTAQITDQFGGTVSPGVKGLTTAVNTQCDYQVAAAGTRPKGDFHVTLMYIGAKTAYTGLKAQTSLYQPVSGLSNALYFTQGHALLVLKGDTLLTVQGLFLNLTSSTGPTGFTDVQTQLVALAKLGLKKV